MKLSTFEIVLRALNEGDIRYLVAGGLAVNAHGYLRLTLDVDLVLALDAENILRAFERLRCLGYRPIVPVTGEQFAQPEMRKRWIEEKGMQVLSFFSDRYPETSVDVFVYSPFDFEVEYRTALEGEVGPGISGRFVSIRTLIGMKEVTGRPKDQDDVQHLRWILEDEKNDD